MRKYYYLLGDAEVIAEETYKDNTDDNFSLFQLRIADSDWIICKVHKINIEAFINSLNSKINQFKY